jgi:hypothetical protein
MAETFIIACFDFPPNSGIGGRRWAKFAKALAAMGHHVHVIKADPVSGDQPSGWMDELNHSHITIHSLPRVYPREISHGPRNLGEKLKYRINIRRLRRKENGTLYDVAIGWEKSFAQKASHLIENLHVTAILATGAPFNLLYYAAKVKQKYPHVHLLADYRDPWINAPNYGMRTLTAAQLQAEIAKQDFIFKHADVVTCPNEFLLDEIKSTATITPKARFEALAHSYDVDDVSAYLDSNRTNLAPQQINLVYGGSLYLGLENEFALLSNAMLRYKAQNSTPAQLRIFTPHAQYKPHFSAIGAQLHFSDVIGKGIFKEVNQAAAIIIFLADHNKDYLTTKFFEFLPFRKPLMYFGPKGHVAQFIESNRLGSIINNVEDFERMVHDLATGTYRFNSDFPLEPLTLDQRTRELVKLIA